MKRAARQGGPRGHLRLRFHGNASQLPVICPAPSSAAWTLELMAFRAQLGRGRWNPNLDTSSLLRNRLTPQPLEVTLRAKRMKSSSTARVCGSRGYDGPAESPGVPPSPPVCDARRCPVRRAELGPRQGAADPPASTQALWRAPSARGTSPQNTPPAWKMRKARWMPTLSLILQVSGQCQCF